MRQVWKFCLDEGVVAMPAGAKPLHVGFQGHSLFLWAEVESSNSCTTRDFIIRGTGSDLPEIETTYIGTAFSGHLVYHVFEVPPYEH